VGARGTEVTDWGFCPAAGDPGPIDPLGLKLCLVSLVATWKVLSIVLREDGKVWASDSGCKLLIIDALGINKKSRTFKPVPTLAGLSGR